MYHACARYQIDINQIHFSVFFFENEKKKDFWFCVTQNWKTTLKKQRCGLDVL